MQLQIPNVVEKEILCDVTCVFRGVSLTLHSIAVLWHVTLHRQDQITLPLTTKNNTIEPLITLISGYVSGF